MARGATYRDAAFATRRQGDRLPAVRLSGRAQRRDAARDGQLVANWVDVFTEPLCAGLLPEAWPEVLVIDSAELRVKSGPRRGQGFHVIGAVGRDPAPAGRPLGPLRLWRLVASPVKDAAAFEHFGAALRGRPRVVISDMDKATRLALANAFADNNGELPDMRIGEWHLGRALRRRIPDAMTADPGSPVMQRLRPAFYTPARWRAFVDAVEHEHTARTHGALTGLLRWIDDHGALVEHQSATRDPHVPNSTSPVEAAPVGDQAPTRGPRRRPHQPRPHEQAARAHGPRPARRDRRPRLGRPAA